MSQWISPTYGKVDNARMIDLMHDFYKRNQDFDSPFNVIIGTDSQNFHLTKMVSVILIQCEGHGGIYFYRVENVEQIKNVQAKLNYETQLSLNHANELLADMAEQSPELMENISFSIHIDAGYSTKGKTKELIPSLVGWIHSCGYQCCVKPDSFAASTVANKISK